MAHQGPRPRLVVRDCSITLAKQYVHSHHRHNKPPAGAFIALSVWYRGEIVGVALVGRPVARGLQDGHTAEVTRCCTDGTHNACSALYGACRRWAKKRRMRLFTYTRMSEPGTSLFASGAEVDGVVKGGRSWDCPSRPRGDAGTKNEDKIRWRLC